MRWLFDGTFFFKYVFNTSRQKSVLKKKKKQTPRTLNLTNWIERYNFWTFILANIIVVLSHSLHPIEIVMFLDLCFLKIFFNLGKSKHNHYFFPTPIFCGYSISCNYNIQDFVFWSAKNNWIAMSIIKLFLKKLDSRKITIKLGWRE